MFFRIAAFLCLSFLPFFGYAKYASLREKLHFSEIFGEMFFAILVLAAFHFLRNFTAFFEAKIEFSAMFFAKCLIVNGFLEEILKTLPLLRHDYGKGKSLCKAKIFAIFLADFEIFAGAILAFRPMRTSVFLIAMRQVSSLPLHLFCTILTAKLLETLGKKRFALCFLPAMFLHAIYDFFNPQGVFGFAASLAVVAAAGFFALKKRE